MNEMMMRLMMAEMKATKGIVKVVTKLEAESQKEMKELLKEHGYNFLVNGKAYRTVNDINPNTTDFVKVKESDEGIFTATVISYKRA